MKTNSDRLYMIQTTMNERDRDREGEGDKEKDKKRERFISITSAKERPCEDLLLLRESNTF